MGGVVCGLGWGLKSRRAEERLCACLSEEMASWKHQSHEDADHEVMGLPMLEMLREDENVDFH